MKRTSFALSSLLILFASGVWGEPTEEDYLYLECLALDTIEKHRDFKKWVEPDSQYKEKVFYSFKDVLFLILKKQYLSIEIFLQVVFDKGTTLEDLKKLNPTKTIAIRSQFNSDEFKDWYATSMRESDKEFKWDWDDKDCSWSCGGEDFTLNREDLSLKLRWWDVDFKDRTFTYQCSILDRDNFYERQQPLYRHEKKMNELHEEKKRKFSEEQRKNNKI